MTPVQPAGGAYAFFPRSFLFPVPGLDFLFRPGAARSGAGQPDLELVDQLKETIQRAEKGRSDPALLQQLRDLVRRYDWPCRADLLSNDFTASGARLEPNWVVDRGDFRLVRGTGLRTIFTMTERSAGPRREESSGLDILGGIIRGIAEPGGRSAQPAPPSSGEIST